jgi:hypothetical protein
MTFTIRPRGLLIAAGIAVLVIGAGVAYATIPDSAGVIHGCYDNKGALRVIDPSSGGACKNNETSLSWSQTGPQGPPGQDGTNGTNGTNGVSGWEMVQEDFPLPPGAGDIVGTAQQDVANCPAGKKVLGGGITTDDWVNSIVRYSGPNAAGTQWRVIIQRTNDGDSPFSGVTEAHLYAICANVS